MKHAAILRKNSLESIDLAVPARRVRLAAADRREQPAAAGVRAAWVLVLACEADQLEATMVGRISCLMLCNHACGLRRRGVIKFVAIVIEHTYFVRQGNLIGEEMGEFLIRKELETAPRKTVLKWHSKRPAPEY